MHQNFYLKNWFINEPAGKKIKLNSRSITVFFERCRRTYAVNINKSIYNKEQNTTYFIFIIYLTKNDV